MAKAPIQSAFVAFDSRSLQNHELYVKFANKYLYSSLGTNMY